MPISDSLFENQLKEIENGNNLDFYANHSDWRLRAGVARQGYSLNTLLNDEHPYVRAAVADQGYGLNKLALDSDVEVITSVIKQGYYLDSYFEHPWWEVRATLASKGYGLDKLINDPEGLVRAAVAMKGYSLDTLINDKDPNVRKQVAGQGFKLDILVDDPHPSVRAAVASKGYELNKLSDDEHWYVRFEVAKHGTHLEKLVNDENWMVRMEVLEQGFGAEKLIDDPVPAVAEKAASLIEKEAAKLSWDYKSSYGSVEIFPKLNSYYDNDNLYMGFDFFDEELGFQEPYCDVTVNVIPLPYLQSTIDTNNNGKEILAFLIKNDFGKLTGQSIQSGFCTYPVFEFREDLLEKIDPDFMAEYKKSYNKDVKVSLEEQIDSAASHRKESKTYIKSDMER